MLKREGWISLIIVIILAFCLWALIPLNRSVLGRSGIQYGLDLQGGVRLVYKAEFSADQIGNESAALDGVMAVIANRVNPLGVTEPNIEKLGTDQIVVDLPNTTLTDTEKARIGQTTLLEFREQQLDSAGNVVKDANGDTVWIPATATINGVEKTLTSSYFKDNTYVTVISTTSQPVLVFEWTTEGAAISKIVTTRLLNKPLGIFEGSGDSAVPLMSEKGTAIAPTVEAVITDSGQISGLSITDAQTLSKQLNAGRLPVPLTLVGQRNLSPSLGADFNDLAVKAGIIGIAAIMLFLILYYRIPGVLATLALAFYVVLTLTIYKLIPVTMTLSGIAGFVLSVGMAIDANVLIFERMKEELLRKQPLPLAVEAGFSRAWTAIWDSNLTTILACIILYWVGSTVAFGDALKGFGLTLGIGVIVSMFTAIITCRTLLRVTVHTGLAKNPALFKPYTGRNVA
jgi:preprotein translocase subunit SecD